MMEKKNRTGRRILLLTFSVLLLVGCNYDEADIDELIERLEQRKEELGDKEDSFVLSNTPSYSTASSIMAPYYGITYAPENAIDGILNTWWSPQQKQTGSKWLKIEIGRKMQIKGMRIHAGSHYPHFVHKGKDYGDLYYKNLRIRRARILFSDGSFEEVILKDVDRIQKIYFDKTHFTSSVTIVLLDYYEQYNGWDDYCISEFDLIAPL